MGRWRRARSGAEGINAMTPDRARGRTLRCTEAERLRIEQRAAAAGMKVSAFVMACALQDDDLAAEAQRREPALVLSGDEQRELLRTVTRLEAGLRHWEALLPGMALSLDEALRVLARLGAGSAGDAETGA